MTTAKPKKRRPIKYVVEMVLSDCFPVSKAECKRVLLASLDLKNAHAGFWGKVTVRSVDID